MKIIPIDTQMLAAILRKGLNTINFILFLKSIIIAVMNPNNGMKHFVLSYSTNSLRLTSL